MSHLSPGKRFASQTIKPVQWRQSDDYKGVAMQFIEGETHPYTYTDVIFVLLGKVVIYLIHIFKLHTPTTLKGAANVTVIGATPRSAMAVTSVSFGAFQTNDGVLADQYAAPLVRARTQPAIVRGPLQRVTVVPFGAPVAVFARRVVLTNAPACGNTRTNVIRPFVAKRTTTKGGFTHPRSRNPLLLPVSASQIEA